MQTTEQTKLLKLNGEYLKLYVTTNSTLPKLVKNSGSMVIYHDPTKYQIDNGETSVNKYLSNDFKIYKESETGKYEIGKNLSENQIKSAEDVESYINSEWKENNSNYIYLGNELIAGGWGFNNKEQKESAIAQLALLPLNINRIDETLDYLNEAITEGDNRVKAYFAYYVEKNSDLADDGLYVSYKDINSDFFINSYNTDIKNIFNLLQPAEYKDITINTIKNNYVFSFYDQINNDIIKFSEENPNVNGTKYIIEKNNKLYVPVGCFADQHEIKINYYENDTNGITHIECNKIENTSQFNNGLYTAVEYNYSNNYNADTNQRLYVYSWNDIKKIGTVTNTPVNIYAEDTLLKNTLYFHPKNYNKEHQLLMDVRYKINGTPENKYKYFPGGSQLPFKSIENIIKSYTKELETKTIIPKFLIHYSDVKRISNILDTNNAYTDDYAVKIKATDLSKHKLIVEDDYVEIDYNFSLIYGSALPLIEFALPNVYLIKNIYIYWKNNLNNENRSMTNITGWFRIIRNIQMTINPLANNVFSDYPWQRINYNLFYLIHNSQIFKGTATIRIEFYEINKNILLNNIPTNSIYTDYEQLKGTGDNAYLDLLDLSYKGIPDIILNDEFDSLHWVNGNGLTGFWNYLNKGFNIDLGGQTTETTDDDTDPNHVKLTPQERIYSQKYRDENVVLY